MCESTAYLLQDGKEEQVFESVDFLEYNEDQVRMVNLFGERWHETEEGRGFMDFLASPSIVLYPLFFSLIKNDLATSVYHMSGGAYDGKFAKPLAKHNLYANVSDLFRPDERMLRIAELSNTSNEAAYGKWPMGNDGFITTRRPDEAIEVINAYGLKARVVSQVAYAKNGKTGISLAGISASTGGDVYFSGKD